MMLSGRYDTDGMSLDELVAALRAHCVELRTLRNSIGRKLHIGRTSFSNTHSVAFCGRILNGGFVVTAGAYSHYEDDDREDVFCVKCAMSLNTANPYA